MTFAATFAAWQVVASSLWAELIESVGKNIVVPIVIALIGAIAASPLLQAWVTRYLVKRVVGKEVDKVVGQLSLAGQAVGQVGREVDKVVGQVTNGDAVGSPKLRTDLDWSIANGTEILTQLEGLRQDFGRFRDEVRGRFDRVEGDASEDRANRRSGDEAIERRVAALEQPA